MKEVWLLVAITLCFKTSWSQLSETSAIQNIRLVGGRNNYSGRIEIQYNGTWGTICDTFWSQQDADVACRMLGFDGASCATSNAYFGAANTSVPIWMDRLLCRGTEKFLDSCRFNGWGPSTFICSSHNNDAGAVCRNESQLGTPTLTFVNSTTRSITLTWPRADISESISRVRYRIQYNSSEFSFPRSYYSFPSPNDDGPYYATLSYLRKSTNYSLAIRTEGVPEECPSEYLFNAFSPYSSPIQVKTQDKVRPSNFKVRLVPPRNGLNFSGRVEVNYNNTGWGTVCDYFFSWSDADVICRMLNYTGAACSVSNAVLGRGKGDILLTRVQCRAGEILEDCTYDFYDKNNRTHTRTCRVNHFDDAGVVCRPDPEDFLPPPEDFNITLSETSSSTIVFNWKRYIFPSYVSNTGFSRRRFRIEVSRSDRPRSTFYYYPTSTATSYRATRFSLGITINATIRALGSLGRYNCLSSLDGAQSEVASITTFERPPSSAPLNFHISVVNCTAILAEWDLPDFSSRNGIIQGYKLFYEARVEGVESSVDLSANVTEYIIEGLEPATSYVVSVLAYTVGDGPRSVRLTATTNDNNICHTDIIDFFGINGNDLDRVTIFLFGFFRRSVDVFCGSSLPDVQIDWFFSNGTKVGLASRRIREGHYPNGTTVLQIGYTGGVTECDAGIYTCRANKTTVGDTRVQQRTFKVTYNRGPPTPDRPSILSVTSNTVVLSWPQYECDGGHNLEAFNIRIGFYRSTVFSGLTYRYIYNIEASLTNFTVTTLNPSTSYFISVQAVAQDFTRSGYSRSVSILTLPPAPKPPGTVSVILVAPNIIFVRWTRPSDIEGNIAYYTVYATPIISRTSFTPRSKRQTTSFQVVAKNFSSSATSGNVTLPQLGVEYHVQVSVTVFDRASGTNRESLFSAVTPKSTLFVPVEGLPVLRDVRVSESSNTSLTVSWTPPSNSGDAITGYLVEFSATVDGRTPGGNVVSYSHEGNATASSDATSYTIEPLIPATPYLIKLAVLTNRGEGMQVTTSETTENANTDFERYVYFHVRFGPVVSCSAFRTSLSGQENVVNEQIFGYLKKSCNCGFTDSNVLSEFFSCGEQDHQIIYRAQLLGTRNYSAIALVEMLQNWVNTGMAFVTVNNFRMQLDPSCPTRLDTLDDPECPTVIVQTQTTSSTSEPKTTSVSKPPQPSQTSTDSKIDQSQHVGITAAQLGGMFVGLIIALLLIVLIVLIIVVSFWKFNRYRSEGKSGGRSLPNTDRDSVMQFANLENSGEGFGEGKFADNFN